MNTYYTYLYIDPKNNNPIYVGKGQDKRAWAHFTKMSNPRLTHTLKKRIEEGYSIEPILTYWPSEKAAYAAEIFWIAVYGREDLDKGTLFNRTDGGDAPPSAKGKKRTDAWKEKHQIPCKEATKVKIGDANRNRKLGPSWNKDIACSTITKEKISKTRSEQKLEPWNKDIPMCDDTKNKVSQSKTKFIFYTPKGIYNIKREMVLAFPEFTVSQLERFCAGSLKGFSRERKV